MAIGWIRSYKKEYTAVRAGDQTLRWRQRQSQFRVSYQAPVFADRQATQSVGALGWGSTVELPNGIEAGDVTEIRLDQTTRFVMSEDVVEIAFVKLNEDPKKFGRHVLWSVSDPAKKKDELLWGDTVQILSRNGDQLTIMARGKKGRIDADCVQDEPILEIYFIDVGQGDGVLIRTPDLRHMVIDGGLERRKQQSGKSAADFVDWKFFSDYGDFKIRLDSMIASHSDNDHYGGLHDLIRDTKIADRELDCDGCDIKSVGHPGLSRWEKRAAASPPHHQGLGPMKDGFFIRLLEDNADVERSIINGEPDELSGPWKSFFKAVINNDPNTEIARLGVTEEQINSGNPLPVLWSNDNQYSISILGPVTSTVDGKPALKALRYGGSVTKSKNTNGHSVCLRIDYGDARILLTGDLNKASMDWIAGTYKQRMSEWKCDVAKACHHGSHDISFNFLEQVNAAATVISSGDAEGHAHPRPEIVGASAITGRRLIDAASDHLVTPLIYMTEVERSVSIGAVNRIDFANLPTQGGTASGTILGRHVDELNDRALLSPEQKAEHKEAVAVINARTDLTSKQKTAERSRDLKARARQEKEKIRSLNLEPMMLNRSTNSAFNLTVPTGPIGSRNEQRSVWNSRVVEKLHYGLVNVRTDGKTIMCATMDETEDDWIVHHFDALAGQ